MATKKIIKKSTNEEPSQVKSLKIRLAELEKELKEADANYNYQLGKAESAQEQVRKIEETRKNDFRFFDNQKERWMEEVFFLRRFIMLLTVDAGKSEQVAKLIEEMQQRGFGR